MKIEEDPKPSESASRQRVARRKVYNGLRTWRLLSSDLDGSESEKTARRERLLTPSEVAAELDITERTVYTWLRSGKLRGKKFGGSWRIHAREVAIVPPDLDSL